MKNGWKRWIRGWSLIVILLSVLSVSGCSVSEEDGLQEVTEKVSQEPEVSQKDSGKSEDQEKPGQTEGDTDTGSKKSAEKKIWVYVCGAVNAPGVYELKEDARLYEAIELAGGVNQEAAPEVLNQARVLADGERIYVPKQDEAESYSLQDQGLESNAGTADTRGKININTAGKEELMTLPGIGEAKAEKILRYREEHGAFRSIEDVMQIEGIKEGVFNKIKEDITNNLTSLYENKEQKKELRTKVKEKISKLSRRETEESDKKILHQIKSLAEYKNADTIFCYVSTEKEINTIPLLQEILDSGKRLGVPKCTGKGIMDAYEIQNLEQLKIGSYGILEPGEECDIILDPTEIQFAIIPCISCNRKGERLGHGGGYYDRYLEKMPEDCEKAILCRESLMCDEIPTEEHDERMDLVISENGIIRIKKEVCEI